jgi:hypothetical protein
MFLFFGFICLHYFKNNFFVFYFVLVYVCFMFSVFFKYFF